MSKIKKNVSWPNIKYNTKKKLIGILKQKKNNFKKKESKIKLKIKRSTLKYIYVCII